MPLLFQTENDHGGVMDFSLEKTAKSDFVLKLEFSARALDFQSRAIYHAYTQKPQLYSSHLVSAQ